MKAIRARPELINFLTQARRFSEESGFQTAEVKHVMEIMVQNGASGAAQNMIGQAVHGVAEEQKARRIASSIRRAIPSAKVFVTKLDNAGARLEEKLKAKH
jgi:pantoate kinase